MITHLVDADWVIDYLNNRSPARDFLRELLDRAALATSPVVLAEVREGLSGDRSGESRQPLLVALVAGVTVYPIDEALIDSFAELGYLLRSTGQIIGDHDIWIAATALAYDLILISRDQHFERIPGLKLHR